MKMKIYVHSMSSVITNSSEMIYTVDDGKTEEEIMEILRPYIKMDFDEGNTSGNAGDVSVCTGNNKIDDYYDKGDPEYDKNYTIIDVDWAMEHTKDAISRIFGYKSE